MPRTIRRKVYKFGELSEKAKDKAREWYVGDGEVFSYIFEEAGETLRAFCDEFSIDVRNFDFLEMYRSEWRHQLGDDVLALEGPRILSYIWNNHRKLWTGKWYHVNRKDGSRDYVQKYSRVLFEEMCPFTGVCYDQSALQPIYDYMRKPKAGTTLEELLDECLHSLVKDVASEYEARCQNPDEDIEANEYEFLADGSRF